MELEDFNDEDLFIENFDEQENEVDKTETDSKNEDEMTDEQKRKLLESVFEEAEKQVKKKAKTRRPRPTLTERELMAEKGIPALKAEFDNYAFPEEMNPYEKVHILLGKMEFWAHNLFPSMTFNDCLNRFEQLGRKRIVKNAMRRLRLGMPLDDENVEKDDEKEEEEEEKYENNARIGGESDAKIRMNRASSQDKNEVDDEEADDLDAFFERMRTESGKSAEQRVEACIKPTRGEKSKNSSLVDPQLENDSDIEVEQFSTRKRKKIIIDDDDDIF